jgi:Carboxypeptidase regulatory-like domain
MGKHRVLEMTTIAWLAITTVAGAQGPAVPPASPPGTVTLSLADYNRLLDRAENPARPPDTPPIPSVVARADVSIRVTGSRARGTYTLDGEVFRAGSTKVPLVSDATILSAKLGDSPVPLVTDATLASAIVDGPRPFRIELAWGVALSASPGRASLTLPVPIAGSAALSLDLPGRPGDVRIAPGAITRTTVSGDITRVEATLVPGSTTVLSWSSRETVAPSAPREVRTLSDVKTMISVGEADVRMTALVDVTVVRGEPERIELRVPAGFAVTGASGPSLATSEERSGVLGLTVQRPSDRRHQFLLSLERTVGDMAAFETPLLTVAGAERETGEIAVEAVGTVELNVPETLVLRRMDIREANSALRAIARSPVVAALRYHRRGSEVPVVALNVTRFPDSPVIAAIAERAVVTTLATAEGRTLTEIALTMRNRAQPFLRVALPQGASIVSAEVDGQASKPAQGNDGTRIPLLRPGFRPTGPYTVSFVYVQTAAPFGKKGHAELALPKMDVPVSLVEWEMFLPERYRVKRFEGDALPIPVEKEVAEGLVGVPPPPVETVIPPGTGIGRGSGIGSGRGAGIGPGAGGGTGGGVYIAQAGQLMGRVVDSSGTALPGATVRLVHSGTAVNEAISDGAGWFLMSGVPPGRMTITASLIGFQNSSTELTFDAMNARRVDFQLGPATTAETVAVSAEAKSEPELRARVDLPTAQAPSQNVFNLQRRVAGVLPVRIDVPRAGAAYRFVRPLVLDEPTRVSFDYRTK